MSQDSHTATTEKNRIQGMIEKSDLISRDLSWLKFNQRVLDQARKTERTIFERLKFMAITGSNLDEFFMIRVGSFITTSITEKSVSIIQVSGKGLLRNFSLRKSGNSPTNRRNIIKPGLFPHSERIISASPVCRS
jgi:polyphosphate kinase